MNLQAGVNAISADDFLPIFTFVVVHAQVPQLFLLKELMVALIANEDSFGECGKSSCLRNRIALVLIAFGSHYRLLLGDPRSRPATHRRHGRSI